MSRSEESILVIDDEQDFRIAICTILEQKGYRTMTGGDGVEALNLLQRHRFDCMVLDLHMPKVDGLEVLTFIRDRAIDLPVIILTGVQDIRVAVETIKLGAFDFATKPVEPGALLNLVHRALERKRLTRENIALKRALEIHDTRSQIVGSSPVFLECLDLAARVAAADSSVLIQGPSGSGKEVVAAFIHRNSPRKDRPFLAVNCSAIPDTLIESELFGHEKGAFTDAQSKREGLVEVVEGGTLFLDEIGELSMPVQPKLLRFLQTGEYRRVGGNEVRTADLRIVSATNRDLSRDVVDGRFRQDLWYRLNVVTINVPSLKDRGEDILLLADHFLRTKRLSGRPPLSIHESARAAMLSYHWPGNVRELENVIERAAILSTGAMVHAHDLAFAPVASSGGTLGSTAGAPGTMATLKEMEARHIQSVLDNVGWDKKLAARVLGISLKTLYTKLHQHQIKEP